MSSQLRCNYQLFRTWLFMAMWNRSSWRRRWVRRWPVDSRNYQASAHLLQLTWSNTSPQHKRINSWTFQSNSSIQAWKARRVGRRCERPLVKSAWTSRSAPQFIKPMVSVSRAFTSKVSSASTKVTGAALPISTSMKCTAPGYRNTWIQMRPYSNALASSKISSPALLLCATCMCSMSWRQEIFSTIASHHSSHTRARTLCSCRWERSGSRAYQSTSLALCSFQWLASTTSRRPISRPTLPISWSSRH